MSFDLNRLAFATSADEPDQKIRSEIPKELSFSFNCLAQFLGQQIKTPGKIGKAAFERLYQAYHDTFYSGEGGYSDEHRKKFREHIAKLNAHQMEVELNRVFFHLLKKESRLRDFAKNSKQSMLNFIASFGVKVEIWGYGEDIEGKGNPLSQLQIPGLSVPSLPSDAPVLKLLYGRQKVGSKKGQPSLDLVELGFEYDWLGQDAKAQETTLKNIAAHNMNFRRQQEKYNFFSAIAKKHTRTPSNNDFTSENGGLGLGGTSKDKSSSQKMKSASPFEELLNGLTSSFGEGQLRDEKGVLTLTGLFALLIVGITHVFSIFGNFMGQADEAYKNSNPGRPLESEEIQDHYDELFNKYVGKLGKDKEHIRERLTRQWRLNKTPDDKLKGIEALKEALLETGNLEAFDKLRFEQYVSKIKNVAARDYFKRQKQDGKRGWDLLQQHLMREEAYTEVDEILQEKAMSQLQSLANNPEYQDGDVVNAYQQAFDKLNFEAASLGTKSKAQQKQHCQIRNNIGNYMAQVDNQLKQLNQARQKSEKAYKDLEEALKVEAKQTQDKLAAIPAGAEDIKNRQEKITAEFQAKKEQIEKQLLEQKTQIEKILAAKKTIKSQAVHLLSGNLTIFAQNARASHAETAETTADTKLGVEAAFGKSATKDSAKACETSEGFGFATDCGHSSPDSRTEASASKTEPASPKPVLYGFGTKAESEEGSSELETLAESVEGAPEADTLAPKKAKQAKA